jgi:phosphoenolpyruvate carboxylase
MLALDEYARIALADQRTGATTARWGRLWRRCRAKKPSAELAIVHAAARCAPTPSGAPAITHLYHFSKTTSVSDLLEVYVLLKEAGLCRVDA